MKVDLSPRNRDLYSGCELSKQNEKLLLQTPPQEAAPVVRQNLTIILTRVVQAGGTEVLFTGPMSPWVYLMAGALARDLKLAIRYAGKRTEFMVVE